MLVYRNGVLICGAPENPEFANIEGEPRDNVKLALELDKTSIQKNALPTPALSNVGTIYQYIGNTGGNLINGRFYKSVETLSGYEWQEVLFSADYDDITIGKNINNKLELKDEAVTTAKILDDNVTIDKIADDNISTTIEEIATAVDTKLPTEKAVRTELDLKLNKADISTVDGIITITY